VLLSADAVSAAPWPLPAGPWREGLHALARARLVFVTRKTAGAETAGALASHVARHTKMANPGIVHIAPGDIVRWGTSERAALSSFAGRAVFAVSAIGDPAAFEGQLRNAALRIEAARYPDHHAFTEAHVESLMARAGRADAVVSTLKDAVKLGPLWPRTAPPLWYLSQHVIIERGQESLAALIAELVALRRIG
ncbi:MAG TPA: tetraacyldisaccharide 4'-kinase, partial [Gemmatimonadaceae bacterium]|nr:tetraacyldisaccharide 4'-kinase [Gemmatimonadaceae bacterium]